MRSSAPITGGWIWFAVAGLSAGCLPLALRDAWADYRSRDAAGIAASARLVPGNARYLELLAADDTAAESARLRQALKRNPYATSARIQLALNLEQSGGLNEAEQELIEAFRHDRTFLPRWSLANFYFRHEQAANFWHWARASAAIRPTDLGPLFDLCWAADPRGGSIPERVLDGNPATEREYLRFLLHTRRHQPAADSAMRLSTLGDPRDRPLLVGAVDAAIAAGDRPLAVRVWNSVVQAGFVPLSVLTPTSTVTNPQLRLPGVEAGFDWHTVWHPDIARLGNRFEFSGHLEHWELLWQPVPVEPGRHYRLICEYETSNMPGDTGLRWHLGSERSPSIQSRERSLEWLTRATGQELPRLSLVYDRTPGTPKLTGTIRIQKVELIPAAR